MADFIMDAAGVALVSTIVWVAWHMYTSPQVKNDTIVTAYAIDGREDVGKIVATDALSMMRIHSKSARAADVQTYYTQLANGYLDAPKIAQSNKGDYYNIIV